MSWIGASLPRAEDPRLLSGRGRFIDDVDRPAQLWLRVVRSQVAHGRLSRIDAAAAGEMAGVIGVFTASDFGDLPRIPIRLAVEAPGLEPAAGRPALDEFLQPVLAIDRVRYVGEPLAVIVAEDPYVAEDAAELMTVDVEELSPVLDAREGAAVGAPRLWESWGNEAARLEVGYGDVEAAFAAADRVVTAEVEIGRHAAVPLEPRGLLAEYDAASGRLEIWGATKVPNFNRRLLARLLDLPEDGVYMHQVDAGGGFGARGEFYPEDFLVPSLARRLGRPVKWVEDRAEHLVASNHSRQQRHQIAAAFDAQGRLLGLRDEIWHDNGAYLRTHGVAVPELTITMLPGPYRVPAYRGLIHVVLTNKTPCGTYRAPGRYEGTLAREHLFDVAATQLNIDPLELRRRNLLTRTELPHRRPFSALGTEMLLDEGDYHGLLERALEHFGFEEWRARARQARSEGRLLGAGMGFFLEKSGFGPSDSALVEVMPSGDIRVAAGGTSLGQGLETVMAQIAADELGIEPHRITVVHTDSELAPDGTGSWASRSTVMSGSAVREAARTVAASLRARTARLLGSPESDIELVGGRAVAAGEEGRSLTFGQIAAAMEREGSGAAHGEGCGLRATAVFEVSHMTYPYGLHLALIEVDPETGGVSLLRFAAAYEVGRAVNPALVAGQLQGGAAQGIGGALFEEFRYDESGQPLAVSFMDYLLPGACELPAIETLVLEEAPARTNPLGVRGAGEGGITAAGAAIANAVRDALGIQGPLPGLPLTPSVVHQLLSSAGPRSASPASPTA